MISKDKIAQIVTEYIADSGVFLVEVKVSATNVIEVLVDSIDGIMIDYCIALSKHIETFFDREVEDFELTVASAGISDPFKLTAQYHKHSGKEVEAILKSGNKLKGILGDVTDSGFSVSYQVKELLEGKKRKELVDKQESLSYDEVKSVRLVLKF